MDLAGIEPASSGVNTDMLTIYNTGPDPRNYCKTKKALLQELFLFDTRLIACGVTGYISVDYKIAYKLYAVKRRKKLKFLAYFQSFLFFLPKFLFYFTKIYIKCNFMSNQDSNLDPNSEREKDKNIQNVGTKNKDKNEDERKTEDVKTDTNQEENELEKYKALAEENLNGWKRAKADFINYKKDQENRMGEFIKYANEDIITGLLPIVDGFRLAMKHLPEDLKNSDWVKGVMCVKGQLESFLKEIGVEEIKSIGEKFDPNLFESVGEEESGVEEGIVVCEIQKGYKMFGKVIRVSKVKISKKVNIIDITP